MRQTMKNVIRTIKTLFVTVVLCMSTFTPVHALKIADFYQSARSGDWIEMKSNDGLVTRTTVLGIKDGVLEIEIISTHKGQLISQAQEYINIDEGKIIVIKVTAADGLLREIYPDEKTDDFMTLDFEKKGEDTVEVPAGTFSCERYRAIFNDYVIDAWITDQVPLIHLVKVKMRGAVVELLNYGNEQSANTPQ